MLRLDSSVNLIEEVMFSGKSFMNIKNNNGAKTVP